jgi:hypothetical protein
MRKQTRWNRPVEGTKKGTAVPFYSFSAVSTPPISEERTE